MSSTNFNIRMDESLKERAFPVIESYGLTPAQAVKLFLNQIADTKTIPLSFQHNSNRIYNEATRQSLIEAREEFTTAKRYSNLEEMMKDITAF
ncbi:type II toxin-antitoxin system RelB/DinJ family antitoxin [Stenoxybacter acetivorans]|uniref:type II toxin-antitoxin system RelB/DinJ family antitoxin n=1 Tax=Stenoxybacter acetivorans TaxID=422441 RepID=UPI00056CBBF4|nr:type II toxin-antitoxin system RelB/DinJ family antitoxin [Stenoxybacter acetivorans]